MHGKIMKKLFCAGAIALAALAPLVQAEEKKTFNLAWTIYVGWMPWKYADESGIMKKWADKYGIEVNISQINDYVESINQYSAGQFDGVVATSMDALSIPAAGGVDTTALIVGSYSNGNDGLVMKGTDDLKQIKGQQVHLVELSVSHYILAKALDSVGLSEKDVQVVNTSDADIVAAFGTADVRNVATWSPLLQEVAAAPEAHQVFDSASVPGHVKDLLIVNSETLADNPAFGKAVTGAWYEVMAIMASDTPQGAELRAQLGAASGTDQAGYEAQLKGTHMFYQPAEAVAFISGEPAHEAMDSVRKFSFDHGLLGDGADSADFVGIAMPAGALGDQANLKLRFDTIYMQMAADGAL
ncbi:putative urea ABC transporter substrate-binding protein [Pseudomonas sp.]|uniref:putative urea ABC transporter substrate-binding protein n=1 Tax=Pseudomonas sp. TaxID=306 RepID=UPI003D0D0A46